MLKNFVFTFLVLVFSLIPISCEQLEKVTAILSESEIVSGLKEALNIGATTAGNQLSQTDGYFGNALLRIALPPEAKPLIENISLIPGGQTLLNEVVLKMNRGAEKAASKAAPIFVNAITNMTVADGRNILVGNDSAATSFLRQKTFSQLNLAFRPEINTAMNEVGAATAWNSLFGNYNSYVSTFPGNLLNLDTVNSNLGAYATGKALNGLFIKVADQEKLIRDNPAQRTTDLLKKVFAEQDPK